MALRFLLIDDDSDDRDLFGEALHAIDPEIIFYSVPGCRKALAKLDSQEIMLPDIIFLDINLPAISGWQCLSLLKGHELYKQIPVILYSTTAHLEDIEKMQKLGGLCLITKPARFSTLKKVLGTVIKHLRNGSLSFLAETSALQQDITNTEINREQRSD